MVIVVTGEESDSSVQRGKTILKLNTVEKRINKREKLEHYAHQNYNQVLISVRSLKVTIDFRRPPLRTGLAMPGEVRPSVSLGFS